MVIGSGASQPAKLILVEMMLTETSSRFTRTTSLQLLSLSGGITRTEGKVIFYPCCKRDNSLRLVEMRFLVESAGFIVENITEVRGVDLIVELKPIYE